MQLEPTPAESSQEASGEQLSGKDVGSISMEPREGPDGQVGVGGGGAGVDELCLLLSAENEWMFAWTCTRVYTSSSLVRAFSDTRRSRAPSPSHFNALAQVGNLNAPSELRRISELSSGVSTRYSK